MSDTAPGTPSDLAPVVDLRGRIGSSDDRVRATPTDRALDGIVDDLAHRAAVPDEVLARLDSALPRRSRSLTMATGVLSGVQLFLALPWLTGADPFGLLGHPVSPHVTRDGALGVVIAIAGILATWRARWSLPCFLMATGALGAQVVAGLVDESIAEVGAHELVHLPAVLLTVLIGLSARRFRSLGPTGRSSDG